MLSALEVFSQADMTFVQVYQAIVRYLAPLLAGVLLFRIFKPMLTFRREPEIWAWLVLRDGKRLPITHWESVIGRSKRSDVIVDIPTISRSHAVLTRYDDGSWTIADAGSKAGVMVNGQKVQIAALEMEDVIGIGGVEMTLLPISRRQEIKLAQLRTKAAHPMTAVVHALLLTAFQFLCCVSYLLNGNGQTAQSVLIGFGGIVVCQWALLLFYIFIKNTLCSISLSLFTLFIFHFYIFPNMTS